MIKLGTIGWDGSDDFVVLGHEQEDGVTLIRVQLIGERNIAEDLKPTTGQGKQILCSLTTGVMRIPKPGTRVVVAIPDGMEEALGAAVILGAIEPHPSDQLNTDRVVMDFGEDTHVVIKGKSVSLSDYDQRFISVGQPRSGGDPGINIFNSDGSCVVIQDGVVGVMAVSGGTPKSLLQLKTSGVDLACVGGALIKLDSTEFYTFAQVGTLFTVQTKIGPGAVSTSKARTKDPDNNEVDSASVYISQV